VQEDAAKRGEALELGLGHAVIGLLSGPGGEKQIRIRVWGKRKTLFSISRFGLCARRCTEALELGLGHAIVGLLSGPGGVL
jgi:hypothetical protein